MKENDQELINRIRDGDEVGIEILYKEYRVPFFRWAKKRFGLDMEAASDIFQDTVIVIYKNVRHEKLLTLEHTLKTYVFAIGKNLIFKKLKKDKYRSTIELSDLELQYVDESVENAQEKEIINEVVGNLAEPCKTIIRLFYYKRFTLESIANHLDYKDENVVKVIKHRCMNELIKRFKKLNK